MLGALSPAEWSTGAAITVAVIAAVVQLRNSSRDARERRELAFHTEVSSRTAAHAAADAERYAAALDSYDKHVDQLQADNDRLRAALAKCEEACAKCQADARRLTREIEENERQIRLFMRMREDATDRFKKGETDG